MARIGITVYVKADGTYGLFENGLRQNVIFLYQLLSQEHEVFLLNHGETQPTESLAAYGVPDNKVVRRIDGADFVIGLGAGISREDLDHYKKTAKVLAYKAGNGGIISMESVCSKPIRKDAENYYDHDFYDAILMTPQHERTYKSWCETVYKCKVHIVPQVWAPTFIPQGFGYVPTNKFRFACLDPNITVMKTAHYPCLVAEAMYRESPELFQSFYVTNAIQFANHPHFAKFCGALSIFKNKIATVEPRFHGTTFMKDHMDVMITHSWENSLNYVYLEALYGNYPVIHNSEFLPVGYYYDSFSPVNKASYLCEAVKAHNDNSNTATDYLWTVSSANKKLLKTYEQALL